MEQSKYPVLHPQAASRIVDDSAVIVLADTGQVNVFNAVGTRIWDLIDGKRTPQDIARVIQSEYDVSPETATQDVEAFLKALLEIKAITYQDQPA